MRGIYAIVDLDTVDRYELDPIAFAEELSKAGPCALQLRAKRCDGARFLALARSIETVARTHGVPFFVNDRVDVALLAGALGVHVGQTDLSPGEVRRVADPHRRTLRVGLSTHDEDQLEAALAEPIDYVAVGPIFATASKERHDPVLGVDRARALAARAKERRPDLPVVAIGGIDIAGAEALSGAVDMIAVIGALLPLERSLASVGPRLRELAGAFAGVSR